MKRKLDFNRGKKEYLWNIEDALGHLDSERLLLNHDRHRDSWPAEGQRRGLIAQRFYVIKFY